MIDIGGTDIYLNVPAPPRPELEEYSTRLFDKWATYVESSLALPDYYLALDIEEGSIKGAAYVGAALYAVYMGIGNYGSFISGVQTIREQISAASDFLSKEATAPFSASGTKVKTSKHGGALFSLQRLFAKVQRGEISIEEAMRQSEVLFGDEASTNTDFMDKLRDSFFEAPRFHQQLALSLPSTDEEGHPKLDKTGQRSKPTSPSKPSIPPTQLFRIELRRESRKTNRTVRVIPIKK